MVTHTEKWKRDGYLVFRRLLDQDNVNALRAICDAALNQWCRQNTPENEPGGRCHKPDAWIMLHLNHPKYHPTSESLGTLLNTIAHPSILGVLDAVFREPAVHTQINYYIDPSEKRPSNWHRDCQFTANWAGENMNDLISREGDPPREIHMHIPLASTSASQVVPGSHIRPDTPKEHLIRTEDPHSENMPNAIQLPLEPGDIAFFHVNALHRGTYEAGVLRRTIAVTFNRISDPRPATAESMAQRTGYVPSYQPWFRKPGYLDGCSPEAIDFYRRFIDLYENSWSPDYIEGLPAGVRDYYAP